MALSFQATPVSARKYEAKITAIAEKQSPPIHESDRRMIRFAQIHILAACRAGQPRREFSPDECAAHREQAAEYPDAEDQKRRMHAVRDLGRIGEDSRAHYAPITIIVASNNPS